MKEMIYQNNRKIEVIHSGEYAGYKFAILNLGTHPTAYVENKNGFSDYNEANDKTNWLPHGGFTYYGEAYWNKEDKTTYLGWDYAHCTDWASYWSDSENLILNNHKWTTAEIFKEVKSVIHTLKKYGVGVEE